jgi:hypothetical protein
VNARLAKSSLLVFAALMTTLPAAAQTVRSSESGVHPSIKRATPPQIGHNAIRAPLALPIAIHGPVDPTNPSRPLFCNKDVQKQFREAFMKTRNGEERMGLAEAGRSVDFKDGTISFGSWATSAINDGETDERANRMNLLRDDSSIAVFHTHGNNARAVPSAADLKADVPNFVISRFALYVTIPGTSSYVQLDLAVCK